MAKIWCLSVACPVCAYPNDVSFRYCQQCGYKRCEVINTPVPVDKSTIDIGALQSRLSSLFSYESKYDGQKSRLELQLSSFLESLPSPKDFGSASPLDIVYFLIWKDSHGKTQIHADGCPPSSSRERNPCQCPTRLAAGTVDSLIGKIRAIYRDKGRHEDWNERLSLGNPAASVLVRRYLKLVKEEQARIGVVPKQAVPMFVDKLAQLAEHIEGKLRCPGQSPLSLYILARDQAYFKTLMFSADRPGDLGQVRTTEILRFPNDDGLLFNHTFGKTLRGGKSNLFGVKRCQNSVVCAVQGIEKYISMARSLEIDLTDGYLFRTTSKTGTVVNAPVSSEAMGRRLKTYLEELGISEGETAHSFRSGCAISLALTGSRLADIMDHVGWEKEHTAGYYMQLAKVLRHDSTSSQLAEALDENMTVEDWASRYRDLNQLKDFALAFPQSEVKKRKREPKNNGDTLQGYE